MTSTADTGAPARFLHRRTLGNGLRVVLAPHWPSPRAAVSVHYRVGFRSERPGQEGFAHLFEHLMYRGSESLPEDGYFVGMLDQAGTANGTTHQDYTDYVQGVPAAALEQALFREADRMRAPLFTPGELADQLTGVAREITQHRDERRFGGFPWPYLPSVLFRNFANSHDGYGDMERLQQTTVEDCAAFFDAYYTPGNAVLTVVTPHDLETAWRLVVRHFAGIPGRPTAASPCTTEPPLSTDRYLACTEPETDRMAVAVGYRLPDPASDLPGYLAHMVLAGLVQQPVADTPPLSASCGFFGPLDAVEPDALIVTALLPTGSAPAELTEALTEKWAGFADTAVAPAVGATARALAGHHRRQHGDLLERCRALGRLELLLGRAELVDELPAMLEGVTGERVAEAAAGLAEAHRAVLVIEPGRERTRPSVEAPFDEAGPAPTTRSAAELGRTSRGPRPEPPLGDEAEATLEDSCEVTLANRLRMAAVPDTRTGLVELRLRVPLGVEGWRSPGTVTHLLHTADRAVRASARAAHLGGGLRLSTDGQWVDVDCWGPAGERVALLRVLADLLDPGTLPDRFPPGVPPLRRTPGQLMDQALRLHWLRDLPERGAEDSPAEFHRRVLAPRGAVFSAVGGMDPRGLLEDAEEALGSWSAPGSLSAEAVGTDERDGSGLLVVGPRFADSVHVTMSGLESVGESRNPARYLAIALFGGRSGSRLDRWYRPFQSAEHSVYAARDVVAHRMRAMVRMTVRRRSLAEAVAGVQEQARALVAVPPEAEEVEAARRYCAAQLLSAFDAPAKLADALRHTMASGRGLDWVVRRPHLLRAVDGAAVSAAGRDLFASLMDTALVLGDTEDQQVARELGLRTRTEGQGTGAPPSLATVESRS